MKQINRCKRGDTSLEQQIQGVQQRYELICQNTENASIPTQNLLAQAITELGIALEELQVTTEELYQQNAELLAARADVEAERQRYQMLFELAPDGYLVTDAKGVIQEANCTAEVLLNLPRSLLVGKPLVVFVAPSDRSFFRTQLAQLGTSTVQDMSPTRTYLNKGQDRVYIQPRDGAAFPAAVSISMRSTPETKKIASIHWLIRDVSERVQTEEALKQANEQLESRVSQRTAQLSQVNTALQKSEQQYSTLAEAAPVGIFRTDAEGHCLYVNERWCEITGLMLEDALGEGWTQTLHPDDRERVFQEWYQAAQEKLLFQSEYRFCRADGLTPWVLGRAIAERAEDGEITGYVGTITNISDRKQAEEALLQTHDDLEIRVAERTAELVQANVLLKQSEQRYRTLIEAVPNMIWVADTKGFSYDFNGQCQRYLGMTSEEIRDHGWVEAVHPDDRAAVLKQWQESLQNSTPFDAEYRLQRADGVYHWHVVRGLPVYDKQTVVQWIGSCTDIDSLKKMEATRREIGERLTLALDAANLGTWDWDIQTNQIIWSGHHSSLFGLPSDTFGNSFASFMDCVHPEDRPQILEAIESAKQDKSPYNADFRVIWPDGSIHHVSGKGKYYYNAEKEPVRMLGVVMDTSNRKRVEETLRKFSKELEIRVQERTQQLQESEERFRSAFDNAVAGIALVALGGRWLKVNPALCHLLGYSEPELLRLDYQTVTHQDDLVQSLSAVCQLLTSEIASAQIEKRFLHKQGHSVWVICSMSLVRDEQGQPLYLVKQFQDISERHAMEQMKNDFISVVSHELRTPLASIRGSLGLLAAGVLHDEPDATQQMLGIAAHETERLVRLVNDILDLERFESSKFTLDRQWCDATTLLQQVAEVIKPLAEESKITVSLLPDTQSVPVWATPDRLVQVLINLLSNAIKFSPRKSTVTLIVQNQVDQVLFQVQDQGRGIPADKVETIFGQFQQVDASDARDKGGTGLGLTICRNIVQKHGGRIWVESVLGKGSTFYFTLPIPLE